MHHHADVEDPASMQTQSLTENLQLVDCCLLIVSWTIKLCQDVAAML